jgi:acetyltransferase-like isoleucine patch superfamily enzyme
MKTHGDGSFNLKDFKHLGKDVVFESGVKIFHPENISIGDNVYIGHNTILKGYYKNEMIIESGTWIGQNCFFHSAGGIEIGKNVGVGPGVQILSSEHNISNGIKGAILHEQIKFGKVVIGEGSDIGVSSVILGGTIIGKYVQIGAMSLVNKSINDLKIAVGIPCKEIKDIKWIR